MTPDAHPDPTILDRAAAVATGSDHADPVGAPLRVANCSGFYGDRRSAAREMVFGGPIDVLTGDWLAELTMLILARQQSRRPEMGFATTFVEQMGEVLGECMARGIKVVANAGGQNPAGCAQAIEQLCAQQGIDATIATVHGDNLIDRLDDIATRHRLHNADTGESLDELGVVASTANAYLGAWPIVEALNAGADVVITGRVSDAAVVVGPAAWRFGWSRTDFDQLAGAIVAGHVIECGTQCTGGNYSFFDDIDGLEHPGFPVAEIFADGSCVITKHPGTGGAVTVGTVTAQLLYEIQSTVYANPDACVQLDTIEVTPAGVDRVHIGGVRGLPAPDRVKVAVNSQGGWRNSMTFVLTGLDIERKAALAERTLWDHLEGGRAGLQQAQVDLLHTARPDPASAIEATALLRVAVTDPDRTKVGRNFSNAVMEMLLASYPGMYTTTPPADATEIGVYWPVLLPWEEVDGEVVVGDRHITVPGPPHTAPLSLTSAPDSPHPVTATDWSNHDTTWLPLGTIVGARSGDKGGNANVGLWVTDDQAYDWLRWFATAGKLRELMGGEADGLDIERYDLPNLRAINFVIKGLLGRGVAATTRFDPQAKGLGEFLRARVVDLPTGLIGSAAGN